MRILHVSDLHIDQKHLNSQRQVIEALINDVESFHNQCPIDLIVFTGDLSYSGLPEEFGLADENFLTPLLQKTKLSKSQLVLVPGNHDVNRKDIDEYLDAGLQVKLATSDAVNLLFDSGDIDKAAVRLKNWNEFCLKFYEDVEVKRLQGGLSSIHKLVVNGSEVSIIALNSAWRAHGGDEDRQRLIVGERQLTEALQECDSSKLRIVAMHHPLSWLIGFDADQIRLEIERNGCVVLSGHEHEANPTFETSTRGGAFYGRAGCVYQQNNYYNAYEIIDLDESFSSGIVQLRTWWPDRKEFGNGENLISEGKWEFTLNPKVGLPVGPLYGEVMNNLTGLAEDSGVIPHRSNDLERRTLGEFLVKPRMWPMPQREMIAASSAEREKSPKRNANSKNIDLVNAISQKDVLLVCGEQESGVTSTLYWLISQFYESDGEYFPIYIKVTKDRLDSKILEKEIRKCLREIGYQINQDGSLPKVIVALDDLTQDVRSIDRLVMYMKERIPDIKFVLGFHEENHPVEKVLNSNEVPLSKTYVGSFGRRERRELVGKLTKDEGGAEDIFDQVDGIIRSQSLPRTPFIVTVLTSVIKAHPELSSLNESGLLQAYVNVHLGAADIADPEGLEMDYRRREHLLQELAAKLVRENRQSLSRLDAEEFVLTYIKNKGWGDNFSADEILNSLIKRRVLSRDHQNVWFRHPVFLALFAAKAMHEDTEFAELITSDYLKYSEIIRHAAGLSRRNKDFLRGGEDCLNKVIEQISEVNISMFDLIKDRPGWSHVPDIESLQSQLNSSPSQNELDEAVDDFLDQYDEEHPIESSNRLFMPGDNNPFELLNSSVSLLSQIIRTSELTDDVDSKVAALKAALRGWGFVGVVAAVSEDRSSAVKNKLVTLFQEYGIDEERSIELAEQLFAKTIGFMTVLASSGTLESPHIHAVLNCVLDDEEFMSHTANEFHATMLYAHLRFPKWVERLEQTYNKHRTHPVVSELIRTWSLIRYQDQELRPDEARELEDMLVRIYSQDVSRPGPGRIVDRGNQQGRIRQQLQKKRRELLSGENFAGLFNENNE